MKVKSFLVHVPPKAPMMMQSTPGALQLVATVVLLVAAFGAVDGQGLLVYKREISSGSSALDVRTLK